MKAVRDTGLDMIHAAVPLFFSSISEPCIAITVPIAPNKPLATEKIIMASASFCSGVLKMPAASAASDIRLASRMPLTIDVQISRLINQRRERHHFAFSWRKTLPKPIRQPRAPTT